MTEAINQPIEVLAAFKLNRRGNAMITPIVINWHGRRYRTATLGLRYPAPQGSRVLHRFTLTAYPDNSPVPTAPPTDNPTILEVEFNAQTLTWTLIHLSDNLPA